MTFTEWFLFFTTIQVIHFLGTWKLYVKANRKAWEAAIPIYNGIVLMQIIKRPKWWILLLFIPVVNLLMFPVIWIETIRTFGFYKKLDSFLVIATLGLYIFYVNYATEATYNAERSLKPRSELGEWVSSITFAIIAATLVHTYFMQPYTIPTSSLEKTLLVGDYLFVSKFHYGARVPITAVAAPMVHDTIPSIPIPFTGMSLNKSFGSYLKKPQLPYMRIPGFQKIKRNDIVVFSWPADSLATMYGDNSGKFTYKPVDKKTNYVKRCVGIAGDTLSIRDGYVFINGKQTVLPDRAKLQFFYTVYSNKGLSTRTILKYTNKDFERKFVIQVYNKKQLEFIDNFGRLESLGNNKFKLTTFGKAIPREAIRKIGIKVSELSTRTRRMHITEEAAEKLKSNSSVDSIVKQLTPKGIFDKSIFPHSENYKWSQDNMGPIYIPEAGKTVTLNTEVLPFYSEIIKNYEGNDLEINGDDIFINGKLATTYTFQQDYYWMMGDNRHNSLDARYWGFVPFDHVVGKPVFIWFSWDADAPSFVAKLKSIRWDRMFTTVGGNGELVSYFKPFLALLALYFGFKFYRKRKKALNINI